MAALSRREALKTIGLIGLGAAAAALGPQDLALAGNQSPPSDVMHYRRWDGEAYARIARALQRAHVEPDSRSKMNVQLEFNTIVRVRSAVIGERSYPNNDVWLETKYGYIYASLVQPIGTHLPVTPQAELGESGRWGQIIVPISRTYALPYSENYYVERIYYGSIFRAKALVEGNDGRFYYAIEDPYRRLYVRATHLMLLPEEAFAPISPDVPPEDKRLVFDLSRQTLTAYEGDTAVWATLASSGDNENVTPNGNFTIYQKHIGARMNGDGPSGAPSFYSEAGVPWVCYFTWSRAGTHGTYWHNDFGRTRSKGCINLRIDDAQWVWRWTNPVVQPTDATIQPGKVMPGGTIIEIVQ